MMGQSATRTFGRSLANYIAQHKAKHPDVVHAPTLTAARLICFGRKQSMHGIRGKVLNGEGRMFWMGKGYNV